MWAEGSAATGSNTVAVAWFGTNGNYISNNVSAPLPDGTSTWTELGVDATAPAGAAYGVLYLPRPRTPAACTSTTPASWTNRRQARRHGYPAT